MLTCLLLCLMLPFKEPVARLGSIRGRKAHLRTGWQVLHLMRTAREADLWEAALLPQGPPTTVDDPSILPSKAHIYVTQKESEDWIAALSSCRTSSTVHVSEEPAPSANSSTSTDLRAVGEIGSHSTRLLITEGGMDVVSNIARSSSQSASALSALRVERWLL